MKSTPFLFTHPKRQWENKYISKRLIGINKVMKRQRNKPEIVKLKINPPILSYSLKKGGYVPLQIKHFNKRSTDKLSYLFNKENNQVRSLGGFKCHIYINENGKYELSKSGREYLIKKRVER